MSFGGGRKETFTLEYLIKVTNQGGAAASGPIKQIDTATQSMEKTTISAAASQEKLRAAHEKVTQAQMGVSKAAKGLTFGILGITTAGAEAIGMFGMWQQTQVAVKQAQADVNAALAEGGKGSTEYKKATQELAKANRWASMTTRNLMLSFFDLLPFVVLTINGLMKLKTAFKALQDAKKAEAALKGLGTASKAMAVSNAAATASTVPLTGALRGMSVAAPAAAVGVAKIPGPVRAVAIAVSGLMLRLAPLLIALAAFGVAAVVYANNIGGLKASFDQLGVAVGNAIPQLRGVLTTIGQVTEKLGKGDIKGAIDVLMQKITGETALEQITKKDKEAAKEWEETVQRVKENALQFFDDLAHMDKKEQKKAFFDIGLKGGAGKRFKDVIDGYEKFADTITNFGHAIETANIAQTLQKYGVDIPESMFKKMEFTFEDRFRDISKFFGGKDNPTGGLFNKLANALEKDAEKGGKHMNETLMNFFGKHPELLQMLEDLGFKDVVDLIKVKAAQVIKETKDWATNKIFDNKNPVTKTSFTQDELNKLPQSFKDQFPSTFNKPQQAQPIQQDIILSLKDAAGNTIGAIGKGIVDIGTWLSQQIAQPIAAGFISWIATFQSEWFITELSGWLNNPLGKLYTLVMNVGKAVIVPANVQKAQNIVGLGEWLTTNVAVPIAGEFIKWIAMFQSEWFITELSAWLNRPLTKLFELVMNIGKSVVVPANVQKAKNVMPVVQQLQGFGQWLTTNIGNPIAAGFIKWITTFQSEWFITELSAWLHHPLTKLFELVMNIGKEVVVPANVQKAKNLLPVASIVSEIGARLAPYFNFDNWQKAIDNLVNPLKPKVAQALETAKTELTSTWWKDTPKNKNPQTHVDFTQGMTDKLPENFKNQFPSYFKKQGRMFKPIPVDSVTVSPSNIILNMDDIQGGSMGGCGGAGGSFGGLGGCQLPMDAINVAPKVINVVSTGGQTNMATEVIDSISRGVIALQAVWASGMQALVTVAGATTGAIATLFAQQTVYIFEDFALIGEGWAVVVQGLQEGASQAGNGIYNNLHSGFQQTADNADDLVKHWDVNMNDVQEAASAAGNGIYKNLHSGFQQVADNSDDLAKHWSAVCNSMIKNAKSAASGIKSALNSIPKEIVTIHRIKTVTEGSAAKGGIISAATGRMMTTYGPRMLMIGDNPGGRETLVAIPHDNPGPTLAKVAAMFGDQSNASFSTVNTSGGRGGRGGGRGVRVDIHNHLLERDVLNIINIDKGRMISKYNR